MTPQSVKNLGSGTIRMLNWLARATMALAACWTFLCWPYFLMAKKLPQKCLKPVSTQLIGFLPHFFLEKIWWNMFDLSVASGQLQGLPTKNPNPSNLPSIPKHDFSKLWASSQHCTPRNFPPQLSPTNPQVHKKKKQKKNGWLFSNWNCLPKRLVVNPVSFWLAFFQARIKLLVGGFNPFEKYQSKWESSPSRTENKKNWNHHLKKIFRCFLSTHHSKNQQPQHVFHQKKLRWLRV